MGTVHKPTKKVWQGILVMSECMPAMKLKELKQYDADAVLRAVQWAEKMERLNEKK